MVERGRALITWSVIAVLAAWLPVATLIDRAGEDAPTVAGFVFAAGFAVFALLLPASGLLREFGERQLTAAEQSIRFARERQAQQAANILENRRNNIRALRRSLWSLRASVAFAIVAALVACGSLIVPNRTLFHHPPELVAFSVVELLTALALVLLAGAVVLSIPFTFHLLGGGFERTLESVDVVLSFAAEHPNPESSSPQEPGLDKQPAAAPQHVAPRARSGALAVIAIGVLGLLRWVFRRPSA